MSRDEGMREGLLPGGTPEKKTLRKKAHYMVEGQIDTWFEYSLLFVIFVNVLSLIVSTITVDPECTGSECERLGDKYNKQFEVIEWTSVAVFTCEYFMRIWACVEDPKIAAAGAFWGRVEYMTGVFPVVDLISILPNWISLATFLLAPVFPGITVLESPDFTTAARIIRLVRIFKTDKYLNAFSLLGDVLYENGVLLLATSFYSAMVWVIAASLLHYTERDNPENGHHFQSIPEAMFPTLLMLTGEFPLSEFSNMGQVVAGFVAVIAVAIFAVPTSVLGSGFIQAVQQSQHREFTVET